MAGIFLYAEFRQLFGKKSKIALAVVSNDDNRSVAALMPGNALRMFRARMRKARHDAAAIIAIFKGV